MALYDPSRPDPGRPDNPRRPGEAGVPAGLDPTRDPQKPGPSDTRDSRTPPPSAIREDDGPGVVPPAPSPDSPASPDDKTGRSDPM